MPELRSMRDWLKEDSKNLEIVQITSGYLELIKEVFDLSLEDYALIREGEQQLSLDNVPPTSASKIAAKDFYCDEQVKSTDSADLELEDIFADGENFDRLHKLISNGSKLHKIRQEQGESSKDRDGSEEWDEVIWSHTRLAEFGVAEPSVYYHFLLTHYIAQVFVSKFEILEEKDDIFPPIMSVLLLHKTLYDDSEFSKIADAWCGEKENGKLGWLSLEQLEAYKKAILPQRH